MKQITARKVKDGYNVVISDTRHLYSKSDVYKLIKQQGCKVAGEQNDNKNHTIIAN